MKTCEELAEGIWMSRKTIKDDESNSSQCLNILGTVHYFEYIIFNIYFVLYHVCSLSTYILSIYNIDYIYPIKYKSTKCI